MVINILKFFFCIWMTLLTYRCSGTYWLCRSFCTQTTKNKEKKILLLIKAIFYLHFYSPNFSNTTHWKGMWMFIERIIFVALVFLLQVILIICVLPAKVGYGTMFGCPEWTREQKGVNYWFCTVIHGLWVISGVTVSGPDLAHESKEHSICIVFSQIS